jgi:bisphosphoglycerate-independent phosphoglycerate mutase
MCMPFLDGRDTPPKSAEAYIRCLQDKMDGLRGGRIASIVGRYYAMDRDKRWDRVKIAYDLITLGRAEYQAPSAGLGLEMAYARGENDEFVKPTAIVEPGGEPVRMHDGDAVVFMNFRSDRAREITKAFITPGFKEFEREYVPQLSNYCTLTGYSEEFDVPSLSRPIMYATASANTSPISACASCASRKPRSIRTSPISSMVARKPSIPEKTASWSSRPMWRPTTCNRK